MKNCISLCTFILSSALCAQPITDVEKMREAYLEAEHAAQYENPSVYRQHAKKIKNYPLAPYAEALFLERHLSFQLRHRINRFLKVNNDAPFTKVLKQKWLSYLAKNKYKTMFIENYQDVGDTKLACLNLSWLLENGESEKSIFSKVTPYWLSATSQPKVCDPLFESWKTAGYLTSEVALERLILAVKAKNWGLVPYLKKQLNKGDIHLASLWVDVVKQPSSIFDDNFFFLYNSAERDVFLYGVRRLVFSQPEKISEVWLEKAAKFNISPKLQQQHIRRLAISYAISQHKDGLEFLNRLPDESVDESVKQWRLASTIGNLDWQGTLNTITSLPEKMQKDLAVVYWKARALEGVGDIENALVTYHELAQSRNYYGFLAANRLGEPTRLRHEPLVVDQQDVIRFQQQPNLRRAFELFKLGRGNEARKEWNVLSRGLSDKDKLVVAKMAHDWGWYSRPIFTLAEVGHLNDVELRFPLPYKSLVFDMAKQNNVEPALLFAIARRESSFMADAYSSAGAAGLMQLKPSTASYVAKTKINRSQLFDPDKNVQLGSHYWSYLMERTNQNPILTAAAYNAGLRKVSSWLPEKEMPADAWIETIPYKETRNYVKAVVAYSKVYEKLLSQDNSTFGEITDIRILPAL
ncbi:transglycosylase SLT domain-containing protein [Psychrosphaera sp. 1_MG-2023]|uniref:lytic transglycosylase domain-containing protein n=1 Tax=Psychrosphaera sp. 1_MG-2023 TaxID=3062643 RepID=UPI0026E2FB31|nr:lytic transglycosylase domain-containing protein [Psychrosphaera sp. 1_MG-2023]MDO6718908.1 transglycosylase SLT domain-containing protein [Psychrosphaera sp. 1_MG-2023]